MEDLHNGSPLPKQLWTGKLNYFFLHVVIHTVSRHSNQYVHETNADTWFGSSRNVTSIHDRCLKKSCGSLFWCNNNTFFFGINIFLVFLKKQKHFNASLSNDSYIMIVHDVIIQDNPHNNYSIKFNHMFINPRKLRFWFTVIIF